MFLIKTEVLAGIFAALGGLFGKLSGLTVGAHLLLQYGFTASSVILMIAFNSASLTLFVKALHSGSSLNATVVSSGANFVASAIFGMIFFGEKTGVIWWIGLAAILIGLAIVQSSEKEDTHKSD